MRATPLWIALLLLPVAAWGDSSLPDVKAGDIPAAQRRCLGELRAADQRARALWNAMPPTSFTIGPLDYITAETTVIWPEETETTITVSFLPDRVPGLVVPPTGWIELPRSPSYYDHLHLARTPPTGSSQIWIRSSGRPVVLPQPLLHQLGVVYEAALDRCALLFPTTRRR